MGILKTLSKKMGFGERKRIAEILIDKIPVTGNPPQGRGISLVNHAYQGMPPLVWWTIEQMLVDDQVALGLGVRNGLLSPLEIEIDEDRISSDKAQKQSEWALRNWKFLWEHHGKKLRQTKLAGHAAFEMFYKPGQNPGEIDIARIKALHPSDVRPLRANGRTVGVRVQSRLGSMSLQTAPKILAPKILWTTFGSRYDRPWGESVLEPAYRPWYLKWMSHGVEELTTLWYVKYAATGRILWVADGLLEEDENGNKLSMMDLLRGIAENELSLGTVALPLKLDANGKELIRYERPDVPSSTNPFEWWADNTGRRIWKGLGILPEVIEALGTGSFSGRSIPLVAMLDLLMDEAHELFDSVCQMVFDPLCTLMDGGEPEYALRLIPLSKTVGEDMQGGGEGSGSASNMQPMSKNTQHPIGGGRRDDGNTVDRNRSDSESRDQGGKLSKTDDRKSGFIDQKGKFHRTVTQFSEATDSTDPTANQIIKTASELAAEQIKKGRQQVINLLKKKSNL